MSETVDVVVVGAGLSGLVAARELRRAGAGVLVLEAADRCGGRAYSVTSSLGSRLDLGGQWVGHDHHRLVALADEYGATRFPMHTPAVPTVLDGRGRLQVWSPSVLVALVFLVLLNAARALGVRSATASVHDWLQRVPGRARRLLEVTALISWTADLDRISVRTMMSLVRHQGGLVTMLSTKGGAQEGLITEGVGHLVDALVAELGPAVRTSVVVTSTERSADGVLVRSASGEEFRARRVVVAAPPPTAARITHEPALPEARSDLEAGTFMGSVYKAVAVYPAPFWRPSSAELLLLDAPGVAVFDTSAPGGPGHLCLLVGGPEARALDALGPDERRTALLSRIAAHLGPGVMAPADWHEKSWHLDEHAGGGYLALPDLGAPAATVPLAADPVGRLHWAGSETAEDHPGYLDGAIEAGQRAAREVVAALAND